MTRKPDFRLDAKNKTSHQRDVTAAAAANQKETADMFTEFGRRSPFFASLNANGGGDDGWAREKVKEVQERFGIFAYTAKNLLNECNGDMDKIADMYNKNKRGAATAPAIAKFQLKKFKMNNAAAAPVKIQFKKNKVGFAAAAEAGRIEAAKMIEDQGLLSIRDTQRKRPAWVSDDVLYIPQSEGNDQQSIDSYLTEVDDAVERHGQAKKQRSSVFNLSSMADTLTELVISDTSGSESDTESELDASEWPDPRAPDPSFCCVCGHEFVNGPFEGTVHDDVCSLYCFGLTQ